MLGRWLLFWSSYSPMFALTAVRMDDGPNRTGLFLVAAAGAVCLGAALFAARLAVEPRDRVLVSVEDRGGDVAGYLATYLLPFVVVAEPTRRDVTAYLLFVLLVGVIYTRSSLLSVNPLLYLAGYRLLRAETTSGERIWLLCRSDPPTGVPVRVRAVAAGLALQA